MRRVSTLLLVLSVVCALATSQAATANGPSTLTLAPGACSGLEYDNLDTKFSYKVQLNTVSQSSCLGNVQVSKLYVQGACVDSRDNQIGLSSYNSLTCSEAGSTDSSVCQSVFSNGPTDSRVTVVNSTLGNTYDQANVCANHNRAFVYVKSNCTQSTDLTLTFTEGDYNGPICATIAGHHLSGWAIAVIVVAIFIALVLATWILACCCCGACCCCR